MGIADAPSLSLGQWIAICGGWNARNESAVTPPTEEEFDAAVLRARGGRLDG